MKTMLVYLSIIFTLIISVAQISLDWNNKTSRNKIVSIFVICFIILIALTTSFEKAESDRDLSSQVDSTRKYSRLWYSIRQNTDTTVRKANEIISQNLKLSQGLADSTRAILRNVSKASDKIGNALAGSDGYLCVYLITQNGSDKPTWVLENLDGNVHYDVTITIMDHVAFLEAPDKIEIPPFTMFDTEYVRRNIVTQIIPFVNRNEKTLLFIPAKSSILYSRYLIHITTRRLDYYEEFLRTGNDWTYRLYKLVGKQKKVFKEYTTRKKKTDNWELHFKYNFQNINVGDLQDYREQLNKPHQAIKVIPRIEY